MTKLRMDIFDKEILKLLQTDNSLSTEVIGDRVGLSASACQRRIKRLKSSGVIKQEVVLLDNTKLAGYVTVIVDITLERGGTKTLDKLSSEFIKEPQVQQLYYMAGETDFTLIIASKNMDDFDNLCRTLFMSNPDIKKFTSKVVIKCQKTSLALPID